MARTDIHRPSAPEFDPESYEFIGVYDLKDESGSIERRQQIAQLSSNGYLFTNSNGGCGHCGAHIRYAALMIHPTTMEMLYVGETCLENRFSNLTALEFKTLRERASLNRERATKKETRDAFIASTPEAQALINYDRECQNGEGTPAFISSLAEQLERNGYLSEKQISMILPTIEKDKNRKTELAGREAEKHILIAQGVQAPEGKVLVEGEVVAFKEYANDFGWVRKMIVKSNEGWSVYVTQPSSISPEKGDRVSFLATLTRSQDDQLFAFGKRPTQASIIEKVDAR